MSETNVRAALDARLEAYTPTLVLAWENKVAKPTVGVPFVRVDLIAAPTQTPTLSSDGATDLRWMRGIYQLLLHFPGNTGPAACTALGDALAAHFPRGLTMTYGGITVRTVGYPTLGPPMPKTLDNWYVRPLSIRYSAEIY